MKWRVASWDWQENSKLRPLQGHQICGFWDSLLHLLLINFTQYRPHEKPWYRLYIKRVIFTGRTQVMSGKCMSSAKLQHYWRAQFTITWSGRNMSQYLQAFRKPQAKSNTLNSSFLVLFHPDCHGEQLHMSEITHYAQRAQTWTNRSTYVSFRTCCSACTLSLSVTMVTCANTELI